MSPRFRPSIEIVTAAAALVIIACLALGSPLLRWECIVTAAALVVWALAAQARK